MPALNLTAQGVSLAEMEQKDFYKIIRDRNRILERSRTEMAVRKIKTCAENIFGQTPKTEAVWSATRHRDFTRKMRDFLWKAHNTCTRLVSTEPTLVGTRRGGYAPCAMTKRIWNTSLQNASQRPSPQPGNWQMNYGQEKVALDCQQT